MFYSKFIFIKKGSLSKVWLAACSRKLSKVQIVQTNIEDSVANIVDPASPLALRLSGQLLVGLVRIYQKKVRYLQDDCNDALNKMNMAFRTGKDVDLEDADVQAAPNAITLPSDFDALDLEVEFPLEMDQLNMPIDEVDLDQQDALALADDAALVGLDVGDGGMGLDLAQLDDVTGQLPSGEEQKMLEDIELEIPLGVQEGADDFRPAAVDDDAFMLGDDQMEMPEIQDFHDELAPIEFNLDDDADDKKKKDQEEEEEDDDGEGGDDEAQPKRKAKKKRKRVQKLEEKVELSKGQIKLQLRDTSDIVVDRPTVPLSKRPRTEDVAGFRGMASELVALIQRGLELQDDNREEEEEPVQGDGEQQQEGLDDDMLQMDFDDQMEMLEIADFQDDFAPQPAGEDEQKREEDDDEFAFQDSDESDKNSGWSRRTKKMYHYLATRLEEAPEISYQDVVAGKTRQTAAGMFYELLVLKSHDYINVSQQEPFADIAVTKADNFDKPLPSIDA